MLWYSVHLLYRVSRRYRWRIAERLKLFKRGSFFDSYYLPVRYLSKYRLWVCPAHFMDDLVADGEIYESIEQNIIIHCVRAGFSYIDIGANIGLHLVAAAGNRTSAKASFWAYEPEPRNFAVLRKNLRENQLDEFVTCRQLAIGASSDTCTFFVSAGRNKGSHSLLELGRDGLSETYETIPVEVRPLDYFYEELKDLSLFIKVDVEGAELDVIKGSHHILSTVENILILIEFLPRNLKRSNSTSVDLAALLLKYGFDLYGLQGNGEISPIKVTSNTKGNILAVRGPCSNHIIIELSTN